MVFGPFWVWRGEHSANMSSQETSQETRYLKKLELTTSTLKKSASCLLRHL
jgi:hypothetical protein